MDAVDPPHIPCPKLTLTRTRVKHMSTNTGSTSVLCHPPRVPEVGVEGLLELKSDGGTPEGRQGVQPTCH